MHYLKKFNTLEEYNNYKISGKMLLPNVSYISEEDSVMFNPYIEVANVGDIAYWNGSAVKFSSLDNWNNSLGTPVGVVVIPTGFAPDGKPRIIGLKPVDSNGNASDSHKYIYWEESSSHIDTSLTNYNRVPTTDNAGPISTGSYSYGYLPSDNFDNIQSYVDPVAKYYFDDYDCYIPSPYLGDKPNPEYNKIISSGNNALSDFNGFINTQTLVGLGSDYVAANSAWKYKDGVSNLQWYLPAMGELGYIIPRFNLINNSISTVNGVAVDGDFWSSSEYDSSGAYSLGTNGCVYSNLKDDDFCVRPFAVV